MMRRLWLTLWLVLVPLVLVGCAGPAEPIWASQDRVDAAYYQDAGPTKLTLYTVQSVRSGSGGHTGLMISADQRILFDPAGTFRHPLAPERNDVHFGITEDIRKVYIDYHARETWNVLVQEIEVSPQVAAMVARAVQDYGAVPKAQCSLSTSRILSSIPGFESIPVGYFPNRLAKAFGELPGVTETLITDDDADDNHGVLLQARRTAGGA